METRADLKSAERQEKMGNEVFEKHKEKTINLVFLQEFKFNCDVATQPFVFVSMDLIVMLSHLDADHGCCISGAQTQLFQVGPIGIKFEPACKHKSSSSSHCTHCYLISQNNFNNNFLPRIFIQPNGHQRVFHGFVDQRVDTGDKEVYGPQQGFTVPTQQLLRFCIIPKLILWRETQALPAGRTLMQRPSEVLLTCNSGDFWLRSVKVSPRACCVCTILWKWLMSAVASLKMFSYLLLVSFNNSI